MPTIGVLIVVLLHRLGLTLLGKLVVLATLGLLVRL
jgi:hypothetical protein